MNNIDARIAEILGYKAWREQRGEYSLCVLQRPRDREPWFNCRDQHKAKYQPVSCVDAVEIGFFGDGFPLFSTDPGDAFRVVEKMISDGWRWISESRLATPRYVTSFWRDKAPHSNTQDYDSLPMSICLAAIAAAEKEST